MVRQWICALVLCAAGLPSVQAQSRTCGVILLHGKWGMPASPYLQPVVQKIEPHCQVKLLEMPWSRLRLYDRPYADALEQIRQVVSQWRQAGVDWVALGGQSFGANATLAYMAQVGDVDALLPMAAGHVPENFYQIPDIRRAVEESRQLVGNGQGDTTVVMNDMNQGQRRQVQAPAAAIWSYFDPQGWSNMLRSAAASRKPVPVFWAIGTRDPLYPAVSQAIYRQLPAHPESQYLVVQADHAHTPESAADALQVWLLARMGR
jgi:dienelactone hydrolase